MFKEFEQTKTDAAAKKRTAASLIGAIIVYAAIGGAILYAATGTKRKPPEPEVDVVLTSSLPPLPEKSPPPAFVPEPPRKAPPKLNKAPRKKVLAARPALAPPKALPSAPLEEADPSSAMPPDLTTGDLEERGDAVNMDGDQSGGDGAAALHEIETPRPKERARVVPQPEPATDETLPPPQIVAEETSSPRPRADNPPPVVPIERRRSGAGGVVVVAVTIAASGEVHVREVRGGEPDLVKAVLTVLPRWRFEPARFEGNAVSVDKLLEIPIRIGG